MLESDLEFDSHEWEWDSMNLNTSDEEDTSPPPPCKDIPVYGEAWIKTFWVHEKEENSTGPTSNPTLESDKESTINELHSSILTLTGASSELNLIDEVMPIIHTNSLTETIQIPHVLITSKMMRLSSTF